MSSLKGRPVLVTGADGFIGSHLAERLAAEGAEVRAFCLYTSTGSLGCLEDASPEAVAAMDIRRGDIRDAGFVRDAVKGVDSVFHLAALIAIPYSYTAPSSFVQTNVLGTLNILDAVREDGSVRRMVNTSTSEVYGTPETVPIRESHPLRAQSPYSATKIAADKLCESYAASFSTPVVTLRPFNTYGPRQSARAIIPTILGQLLADVTEVRLGSLWPKRDFTFVGDTVDAFVRMADADITPGETVQLGTGRAVSIGELFEACCRVVGTDAEVIEESERVRPEASEVRELLADPAQARERLGWEPQVSLEDGIGRTAEWLQSRVDAARAVQYHL